MSQIHFFNCDKHNFERTIMNMRISSLVIVLSIMLQSCATQKRVIVKTDKEDAKEVMTRVNTHWQKKHPPQQWSFWEVSAYHTGNIDAYKLTGNKDFLQYSLDWAEHNDWKGAKSDDRTKWKYSYGEKDDYVLFGDWQICFQTYIDLYHLDRKDPSRIARAREVMEYQMSTPQSDYWWWADGLYMVMPVMTKLYHITGDQQYLEKLYEYFVYADDLMFDKEEHLYYRDGKYLYPKHKSANGKKDFWARGTGWVMAGLAKVLADLPKDYQHRNLFQERFVQLARAVARTQQSEGYWTRSILDPDHAPGPETSGTAFFTYGILWGINNGYLAEKEFLPVIERSWQYLRYTALQEDGSVGYIQPIGEKAIPGQIVDQNSTANFGVGAFLLATSELYRFLDR